MVVKCLVCHFPLCCDAKWLRPGMPELQLSATMSLWLVHRAVSLPNWIEFCSLPLLAKRQGYWFIGKLLLTAWSSLCGKWHLCSYTNITIKVSMQWAASLFESSINNCYWSSNIKQIFSEHNILIEFIILIKTFVFSPTESKIHL